MRWMRFTVDGRTAYGLVEGDGVAEVSGDPFTGYAATGLRHALDAVKIEIPVEPRNFYAAGLNYVRHVQEVAAKQGLAVQVPAKPDMGYRAVSALIAHGETVVIPADATEAVQYEGELVAVVGRTAKHLSEADALSCLLGWTIGNDVSERSWQKSDRTFWRSKNTDTFKPMGPWIETAVDLDGLETTVRVNGAVTTQYHTNDMLFGVARFISTMTRYLTLHPGDVIWMGTDGSSPNLVSGDVVEVEISGIGTLRNPCSCGRADGLALRVGWGAPGCVPLEADPLEDLHQRRVLFGGGGREPARDYAAATAIAMGHGGMRTMAAPLMLVGAVVPSPLVPWPAPWITCGQILLGRHRINYAVRRNRGRNLGRS